jgi:hypothetical protein
MPPKEDWIIPEEATALYQKSGLIDEGGIPASEVYRFPSVAEEVS